MDDRAFYRMTPGHFYIHIYFIMPAAALQDLSGSRRRGRYTVIAENEKIYIEGGADYWGLFNYLIGDYLRDAVLSETRSAVWSSAKKGSTEPLQNWFKNFKSMGIMGMIGYIYGIYHLGEKIDTYLSKKD